MRCDWDLVVTAIPACCECRSQDCFALVPQSYNCFPRCLLGMKIFLLDGRSTTPIHGRKTTGMYLQNDSEVSWLISSFLYEFCCFAVAFGPPTLIFDSAEVFRCVMNNFLTGSTRKRESKAGSRLLLKSRVCNHVLFAKKPRSRCLNRLLLFRMCRIYLTCPGLCSRNRQQPGRGEAEVGGCCGKLFSKGARKEVGA